MRPTNTETLSDFGVADVDAVARGHDPAQTRVEARDEWLRIDLARSAREGSPGGIGQTIFLERLGAPAGDGTRPVRTAAELRTELERHLVAEFSRAGGAPDPKVAEPEPAPRRDETRIRASAVTEADARKRRAPATGAR